MKTNKLLVAAVLATAIGAPIAGFMGETKVTQPMTSTRRRVPFLHGFPLGADSVANPSWLLSSVRTSGLIRRP